MTYEAFLRSKMELAPASGFEAKPEELNPVLKPHQRDSVLWALRGGRRALFQSFGLGKTVQQLEFCRMAVRHAGGKALIVLPLGAKQEFQRDAAEVLGWSAVPPRVKTMEEAMEAESPIVLTNYERVRDGDIDPRRFTATSLDEASVLRDFGSKTYQTFLEKFRGVQYKLVCTATPSPNRYKELIHYAGYLEVMDTGQALTRFFQRDSSKAGNLQPYPHKEEEFWLWVSSWAMFLQKPSDLGYPDEGYSLPRLEVRWHKIEDGEGEPQTDRDGQTKLLRDAAFSLKDAARVKRESIPARVAEMSALIHESPEDSFLIWHDLEAERHAILKALPEAVDIYGSMELEERERRVTAFADGKIRLLATKKSLSGSGCNFQRHCHRAIFLGIDYEFNDFIQAIHRIYRFLQDKPVRIDVIYTEAESAIRAILLQKWEQHNRLTEKMSAIIREYGLASASRMERMARSIGVKREVVQGKYYKAVHNDCVLETEAIESGSADLIVTSIPFSNHYEYTPSYNDFGHNEDTARFFEQMDFLTPQLLRILKPGRVLACHVKDRVLFGSVTGKGMYTIEPFHALCIQHYMKHGFEYFGMITVVTDVVRENNQTYRLGWSEQNKDGTKMGVGCPEYILLLRKLPTNRSRAYADVPVQKAKEEYGLAQWQIDAHGFWRSSGDRPVSAAELKAMDMTKLTKGYREFSRTHVYDYGEHVEFAQELEAKGRLPKTFMCCAPGSWAEQVWDDVNRMKTLNTSQSQRRKQMHICPLQTDIAERLIRRYSNPGELVLDPFGGLMTVPVCAVKMGRVGLGIELNPEYFHDGADYLAAAEEKRDMPTLFDFLEGAG